MISLHIGQDETVVIADAGSKPPVTYCLPLGIATTASAHLRHDPPTEAEIEDAITAIEDVVMPLHRRIAADKPLVTSDPAVREIALLAGVADTPVMLLELDALERVFDRLATVVTGSTAARQGLPPGSAFAAALLILREFMHHLKLDSIRWAPLA